jgi:hypothetical protein
VYSLYALESDGKKEHHVSHSIAAITATHTCTASGELKIVAVWTMTDEHGSVEIRDWSGATYRDIDYVDQTVRLRRVRVTSASATGTKIAEFMPGPNGTKFMVAPRHAMMRWWLGDKYVP